jgi:hypothetical protein
MLLLPVVAAEGRAMSTSINMKARRRRERIVSRSRRSSGAQRAGTYVSTPARQAARRRPESAAFQLLTTPEARGYGVG